MTSCYPTVFPVKAGSSFFLDQIRDHQYVDLAAYQQLIRKLIYLKYRSYPDIVFVVWQLSCHNSDLQIRHLCITK